MAKASNVSDRNAQADNKLISTRPCVDGCGGEMEIVVSAIRWKSQWMCKKCGATIGKFKGDWTIKDALRLKGLRALVETKAKELKAAKSAEEDASAVYGEARDAAIATCDFVDQRVESEAEAAARVKLFQATEAATAAEIEHGMWKNELDVMLGTVKPPRTYTPMRLPCLQS